MPNSCLNRAVLIHAVVNYDLKQINSIINSSHIFFKMTSSKCHGEVSDLIREYDITEVLIEECLE